MTLAACLIVKDEAAVIERAIGSVRPHVDEVCILDTGSADGTLAILDRLAREPGTPLRVEQGGWREDFAAARNASFAMASPGIRWLLTLDADDELCGGEHLRALAGELERLDRAAAWIVYDRGEQIVGGERVPYVNGYLRLFRRDSGRWTERVHEIYRLAEGLDDIADTLLAHPALVSVRHGRRQARLGHYLPLALKAAADREGSPLGRVSAAWELIAVGDHFGAEAMLRDWLASESAAVEGCGPAQRYRCFAYSLLANALFALGHYRDCRDVCVEWRAYVEAWSEAARQGQAPRPERGIGEAIESLRRQVPQPWMPVALDPRTLPSDSASRA